MIKTYLGVDPGASGALVWFQPDNSTLGVIDMPTSNIRRGKRNVNHTSAPFTAQALRDLPFTIEVCMMEQVGPRPGEGVSSVAAFARAVGVVEGVLAGLNIPTHFVLPRAWQKAVGLRPQAGKDAARELAARLFPQHAELFKRVKDDGRADAALIALYGATFL